MTRRPIFASRVQGFTLTEATVALTLVALLAGFGIPAYGTFLSYYRLHSEAQLLAWALQFARSEAIKRNTRVNVCKTTDLKTCGHAGGYETGWLIHADPGVTGQPDDDDPPIRIEPRALDGITIRGNRPIADLVSYTPYGHPRLLNGGLQMGTFTLCKPGFDAVQVVLANTGRIRIENTRDKCT